MRRLLTLLLLAPLLLTACQPSGSGEEESSPLVVYSGRSKALIEPLVERFRSETSTPIEVRYGTDAQLLAALQEEGTASDADLFWANTTGALAEAVRNDMLVTLPDALLQQPASFRPSGGRWVPVTTRFRVLAFNPEVVDTTALPASVMDLPSMTDFEGRIGWTPTYSSFQDFVTAMRSIHGDEATQQWIEDMLALEPKSYTSNTPMVQALAAGEIDLALTNHYYILRLREGGAEGEYEGYDEPPVEGQPDAPIATYHFDAGDVGNLALVTGAGVLQNSDRPEAARAFLRFLLNDESQRFAATSVHEYPVVDGSELPSYMLPMSEALQISPDFDFEQLEDLDATLDMLRETGVL